MLINFPDHPDISSQGPPRSSSGARALSGRDPGEALDIFVGVKTAIEAPLIAPGAGLFLNALPPPTAPDSEGIALS
jgi:hypothetical protein